MHRRNPQVTSSPSDNTPPLGKVAVAAAAGTVLGTRSRMAGALFLAGIAWLALRRPKPSPPPALLPEEAAGPCQPATTAASLEDICAPSNPFLDYPVDEEEWQDLRVALRPPSSLFTPPDPAAAALNGKRPQSSLLQSAPVYIEVEECPSAGTRDAGSQAILPDTITIPTTPDPPPALLAEVPATNVGQSQAHPPLHPKAGIAAPAASQPAGHSELKEPSSPPPTVAKKRGFLGWLREGE